MALSRDSSLLHATLLHATPYQPPSLIPLATDYAALVPNGGLVAGAVAMVRGPGSYAAAIEMLSVASQSGFTVAFVGLDDLSVVGLVQAGWNLSQVVMIAEGPEMAQVIALLLGAFDVVVVGAIAIDRHWHRLIARARERKSALVVIDGSTAVERHDRWLRQVSPAITFVVDECTWSPPTAAAPFGSPTLRTRVEHHGHSSW